MVNQILQNEIILQYPTTCDFHSIERHAMILVTQILEYSRCKSAPETLHTCVERFAARVLRPQQKNSSSSVLCQVEWILVAQESTELAV